MLLYRRGGSGEDSAKAFLCGSIGLAHLVSAANNPVSRDIHKDRFYIVRQDVFPALDSGFCLGSAHQRDDTPGA